MRRKCHKGFALFVCFSLLRHYTFCSSAGKWMRFLCGCVSSVFSIPSGEGGCWSSVCGGHFVRLPKGPCGKYVSQTHKHTHWSESSEPKWHVLSSVLKVKVHSLEYFCVLFFSFVFFSCMRCALFIPFYAAFLCPQLSYIVVRATPVTRQCLLFLSSSLFVCILNIQTFPASQKLCSYL